MNLVLHLTPEIEAKLKEHAIVTGRRPEDVALHALEDRRNGEPIGPPMLPPEEWVREFDAWVSIHQSRNPRFDDSRDSIYSADFKRYSEIELIDPMAFAQS